MKFIDIIVSNVIKVFQGNKKKSDYLFNVELIKIIKKKNKLLEARAFSLYTIKKLEKILENDKLSMESRINYIKPKKDFIIDGYINYNKIDPEVLNSCYSLVFLYKEIEKNTKLIKEYRNFVIKLQELITSINRTIEEFRFTKNSLGSRIESGRLINKMVKEDLGYDYSNSELVRSNIIESKFNNLFDRQEEIESSLAFFKELQNSTMSTGELDKTTQEEIINILQKL